nr:reverse transcriptase domain-containing protein [Tanacetum cinerariifolium]
MEELCQPSLNGRGGPIAPIAIQATNFGLKNDMIQQVQNSCQFHGLSGDDANKHLDKFLHVTQSIKVNGVTDDALRLYLFPQSLTHHATAWFDRLQRNSINTFKQMSKMFLGGTFMKRCPKECYDSIENITAHHNCWDTSAQRSESSSSITSSSDTKIAALKLKWRKSTKIGNNQGRNQFFQGANQNQNPPPAYQAPGYQAPVHQPQIPQPQVITTNEFTNFMKVNDAILKNMQTNMTSLTNSNLELKNMFGQFMKINTASSSGSRTLPSNIITKPKEDLKGITTRSETSYQGPMIPTSSSSSSTESPILNSEPVVTPIIEPVASPVSVPKPNQRPSIPYPSRLHDQKLHGKANDQREKFFQIFKDLNFNISFADALILMPKFNKTIKTLLTNKDKLRELARIPLNEYYSTVLLKKLPETLGDPDMFLIPCDFPGMAECLALADLSASDNLMPLSVWNKLSLPDLSPMCMTLELTDRSISRSVGVAEDVFVKVGTFHFPANFVVVDFDSDPRVPLILGRSFLKTGIALIDVFEGELTLRVGKEAIPFHLDQTSRYSANYNDMTTNRIDEVDAFLALEDDPTSPEVDQSYIDTERDILILESFLNVDPSLPPLNQGNCLPQVHKELNICEAKTNKSSIDEPPEVELKDLPPHLEYAFLEGDNKLPINITKDLSVKEKTAFITILSRTSEPLLGNSLISKSLGKPRTLCTKKGGFTVVENEENELIPTCLVTGWRVCIDYHKFNEATRKDHFPLPFMDQMLERLAGNQYYCFLDGFFGYFQIPIDPKDQEKTTFTCPYRTFAYRCMPFGLCNAPSTFQSFRNSFQACLSYLKKMLKRCEDTNLCLNWEKSHFMVKEGIVLDHKISINRIEVDKDKVDVIAKLPHPTTVKGMCSFLGHAGFYRRFIKDFSKIARPMTRLLEKATPFLFSKECVEAFQTLKRKLNEAPILIAPDWDMPFELMCDASDFAIGAVRG